MYDLINALELRINKPVILADQAAPKPPYPYIGIKVTSEFIPQVGHHSIVSEDLTEDIKQTIISSPTKVFSITEYSNNLATAGQLAQDAHDWFSFKGYRKLKELGFTVVEVGAIGNRDSLIVDDYERRRGFDVTLRFRHSIERVIESIDRVTGEFNHQDMDMKESE